MARKPAWKIRAYAEATEKIRELEDEGFDVFRMTDYHWRINQTIDVWPSSKKFTFLKSGKIEEYEKWDDLLKIIKENKEELIKSL